MKRRQFVQMALLLSAAPSLLAAAKRFQRGLLWRVTHKKTAANHVYGTIHVADARLEALPRPVQKAFDAAKSLMLEFVPDRYARERFLDAALFHDRQTLEEKIGAEDFERAVRYLAPIGLQREFINKLKPWGVLLNLRNPGGQEGSSLDGRLVQLARARRMPVDQIEDVEEQIFTFDEFPMDSQVALLKHSLIHESELRELAGRTLEAYLAGDLAAIWRLRQEFVARYPDIAGHQAVMTKRVVHDRSVVMAHRMQRQLRRGDAFIALGALHLYGEKGVLALLEGDGYRATRVF